MLTIIYPYRNRDLKRIQRSLNSLSKQTSQQFQVEFVDYGSEITHASKVKQLVKQYAFANYIYLNTKYQPWNKSRALNSSIKNLKEGYCFVADVDMIFREDFIHEAINLQNPDRAVYFKVGFLSKEETALDKSFNDYEMKFESTDEATGLTMCPVKLLKEIRGFDEFYHFWGSEDTDLHVRLKNSGYKVKFYDQDILMLHQWHPTYRLKETDNLSEELQLSHIVRLNYQHLKIADQDKTTKVNEEQWGKVMTEEDESLCVNALSKTIACVKEKIDHFVFIELPNLDKGIHSFKFIEVDTPKTLKHNIKKVLNKRVDSFYNLKEVNDILLLHIISLYRDLPYIFKVSKDKTYIKFSIIIEQ